MDEYYHINEKSGLIIIFMQKKGPFFFSSRVRFLLYLLLLYN